MIVNILGRDYAIAMHTAQDDPKLKQYMGYCDYSVGKIVVQIEPTDPSDVMNMQDIDMLRKKTLRHELIHAFAAESGLTDDSEWAMNEEMTDWIAWQFPKMLAAFKTADAL